MSENMTTDEKPQQEKAAFPIPPATFDFLVLSLKTQAEMQMGLIHFGDETPEPEFRVARHTIDLIAMLQDKTKGNLSLDEQRLLENSLTELRFRYVQALEAHQQKSKAEGQSQA
jgi:hypothetical protein